MNTKFIVSFYLFSYEPTTLYSILSQEIQEKVKGSYYRIFGGNRDYYSKYVRFNGEIILYHFQEAENKKTYILYRYVKAVEKGEPPGILVKMSIKLNTAPALLARDVLKTYCDLQFDGKIYDTHVIQ